jgi:hypothetical protein
MEREHGREEDANVNAKWNGKHGSEVKGKK